MQQATRDLCQGVSASSDFGLACRLEEACAAAETGESELIVLDSQHLQTEHLAQLLQHIKQAGAESALTVISLEDNLLTDESCAILRDALQDTSLCPSLLTITLVGNAGITPLGHEHLKQALTERPDLKVCSAP